jgi:hypothetical protein
MWLRHTVTVAAPSDGGSGTTSGGVSFGTPATITCNIQPISMSEVFDDFGPEAVAEYQLFARLADSSKFVYGARVKKGNQVLYVSARPKVYDQGLPTDHVHVALTEVQIANPA